MYLNNLRRYFIVNVLLLVFCLPVVASAKSTLAEFSSFYLLYIFSKHENIKSSSGSLRTPKKIKKLFNKEVKRKKLMLLGTPKISVSGPKTIFQHGKDKVEIDFTQINRGMFLFNGRVVSADKVYNYAEASALVKKVIGKKSLYSDYAPFYKHAVIGIQVYIKRMSNLKGVESWINYLHSLDFKIKGNGKRTAKKVLNVDHISLSCQGRKLAKLELIENSFRYQNSNTLYSLSWHGQTKGYIFRTKTPKCATYLTAKGVVRVSYPGCPEKDTEVFKESPFYNFVDFAKLCCLVPGCDARVKANIKKLIKKKSAAVNR